MKVRCSKMLSGSIGVRGHGAVQFQHGIAEIPEDRFDALAEALATIDLKLSKAADKAVASKPRRKTRKASRRTA